MIPLLRLDYLLKTAHRILGHTYLYLPVDYIIKDLVKDTDRQMKIHRKRSTAGTSLHGVQYSSLPVMGVFWGFFVEVLLCRHNESLLHFQSLSLPREEVRL